MSETVQVNYDFGALPAGEWRLKRLPNGALAVKSVEVDAQTVDTNRLSVPCVITTQDEDREKDIVVTAGIDLANHKSNPLVMLDHGLFCEGKLYPAIAKAEDPDGGYTVTLEHGKARAVSWFSEKVQDSYQTFQLIAEGFLRGVSIGFRGLQVEYRKDHPPEYRGWPGLCVAKSELLEYSHCPMGINPHALADRIGKGYLGAERLTPMLWKSLSPHLPALKEQVHVSLPDNLAVPAATAVQVAATTQPPAVAPDNNNHDGGKSVSATASTGATTQTQAATNPKATPTPAQAKAATAKADDKDKDGEGKDGEGKGMNEGSGSDGGSFVPLDDGKGDGKGDKPEGKDEPDEPEESEEDPTKDWLPGARVLAGCYALITGLGQFLAEGAGQQENPVIREALDAYSEQTEAMRSHCAETFRANYADYDPLDKDREEGENGNEGGEGGEDRREDGKALVGSAVVKQILGRHPTLAGVAKGHSLADALAHKTAECERLKADLAKANAALEKAATHLEALQREVRKKLKRK